MKKWIKWLSAFASLLLLAELTARLVIGLGNPLLFEYSSEYDYQLLPNQSTTRLFKTISTNSLGLRGQEPKKDTRTIAKLGDSVVHGGERLSNNELSSSLLNEKLDGRGSVINISCGSWGPENQRKFLLSHPELQFDVILYYISSHDLQDTIESFSPVGISVDYPSIKPLFGLYETLESFVIKDMLFPSDTLVHQEDGLGRTALPDLLSYLKKRSNRVHVFVHPTIAELQAGTLGWRGNRIVQMLEEEGLSFQSNLGSMKPEFYRDDIHLNEKGHEFLAEQAYQLLLDRDWLD